MLLQDAFMYIFTHSKYSVKLHKQHCVCSKASSTSARIRSVFKAVYAFKKSTYIPNVFPQGLSVVRADSWPPGRSGGSQAWWWGQRWPPQRGRHTPTQRHASCETGRQSPSGSSSLNEGRKRKKRERETEEVLKITRAKRQLQDSVHKNWSALLDLDWLDFVQEPDSASAPTGACY